MNKSMVNLDINQIEKVYPYRYRWSSTLGMIVTSGVGAFGMAWFALSGSWLWWLGSAFMFVLFLGGLYIAVINMFGNRRIIMTKESIYLPSIWRSEKYSVILFSEVTKMGLMDVQGNATLQLFVGPKEYTVVHTWLPSLDVFNEILEIIRARVNISS